MAPYNTRLRKRKAESDYQAVRAEFGLDPMPIEEARRRQREHEREARAETAAAAAGIGSSSPVSSGNTTVSANTSENCSTAFASPVPAYPLILK